MMLYPLIIATKTWFRCTGDQQLAWTFFFHVTYQALNYLDNLALKLLYMCNNNFNLRNIMGDEILLNFGAKFQCWFEILHVKLQNCRGNLPYITVPRWRRSFKMLWIKMSQALKDALENLNTWKSTSRRILTVSKNSENCQLKPNLSSKRLRDWSSLSIRSRINM